MWIKHCLLRSKLASIALPCWSWWSKNKKELVDCYISYYVNKLDKMKSFKFLDMFYGALKLTLVGQVGNLERMVCIDSELGDLR